MFKPKVLISIKNIEDLSLKADGYVLGYEKFTLFASHSFKYEELLKIKQLDKVYLLLNALIHQDKWEEFKKEADKLTKLPINFIIQDIGAFNYIKEIVGPDRVIFDSSTLICNKQDFETYQNVLGSKIAISSCLSFDETKEICSLGNSLVKVFGYVPIYQSYRKVLSLYEDEKSIKINGENINLREDTRPNLYSIIENEYGTTVFSSKIISYLGKLKELDNVSIIFADSYNIEDESFKFVLDLINCELYEELDENTIKNRLISLNLSLAEELKS